MFTYLLFTYQHFDVNSYLNIIFYFRTLLSIQAVLQEVIQLPVAIHRAAHILQAAAILSLDIHRRLATRNPDILKVNQVATVNLPAMVNLLPAGKLLYRILMAVVAIINRHQMVSTRRQVVNIRLQVAILNLNMAAVRFRLTGKVAVDIQLLLAAVNHIMALQLPDMALQLPDTALQVAKLPDMVNKCLLPVMVVVWLPLVDMEEVCTIYKVFI